MTDYRNQYGIPYNPRLHWGWVAVVGAIAAATIYVGSRWRVSPVSAE